MDKILITGGSGLLGSNLAFSAPKRFDTYLICHESRVEIDGCTSFALDLRESDATAKKVREIKPDCIIHCAALTNVDYCETHQEEAEALNVDATRNLAAVSSEIGCKLIYISTDSVFDGEKGMYTEQDMPNPLNVYARTKLDGESVAMECDNHTVARTNIYGWNAQEKLSIAEWFLKNLREGREISGFTDIYFTPILVNNLADALLELYDKDKSGLYHIAGSERINKYDFGLRLAGVFGLDQSLIQSATSDEIKLTAKRPKDMSLDVGKAEKELNTPLLGVEDGLREFKKLEDNGHVSKLKGCIK